MPTTTVNSREMEIHSPLVRLCIEIACASSENVEKWRRQRRSLERLPSPLAEALLHRLLRRRLLFPSLLEVFKLGVEEIDLRGQSSVDAEWMTYLGAFRYLRSLNVADCPRITNSVIWPISGMTSLKDVDLSRCVKVTDAGIRHLLSLPNLEKLLISETGVAANGIKLLASLTNLTMLDLGGLPVTDQALSSLQVLTKLEYLDVWGSKISDEGAAILKEFPKLNFLNLAWTNVTKLPNLKSLGGLNMSNCAIHSVIEEDGEKAPLKNLIVHGASFVDVQKVLSYIDTRCLSFLDASNTSIGQVAFMQHMSVLEHLDLSFSMMEDDSVAPIMCIGAHLKHLNLNNTKITSAGVGTLAGHVPNLENLSLSHTSIDDIAVAYISLMPLLETVNLSYTNIRGFIYHNGDDQEDILSLQELQNLKYLKSLDLSGTHIKDAALSPLPSFQELSRLSLKNASLTDDSLLHLLSVKELVHLSIRDALLTDAALVALSPLTTLKVLDVRGCWLLTTDALRLVMKKNPGLEVRHENLHLPPLDDTSSYVSGSPSWGSSQKSKIKHRAGKLLMPPTSLSPFKREVLDQRIKYNRDELLAFQHISPTCTVPLFIAWNVALPAGIRLSTDTFNVFM